jgi:PAS domain-containing protein
VQGAQAPSLARTVDGVTASGEFPLRVVEELRRTEVFALEGQPMRSQQLADPLNRPVESLRVGVQVIDFNWRYVRVNPTAATHVRRLVTELEGQSMLDLCPDIDNTAMFRLLERCLNDRVSDEFEDLFTGTRAGSTCGWNPYGKASASIRSTSTSGSCGDSRWTQPPEPSASSRRQQWQSLTGGQIAES